MDLVGGDWEDGERRDFMIGGGAEESGDDCGDGEGGGGGM